MLSKKEPGKDTFIKWSTVIRITPLLKEAIHPKYPPCGASPDGYVN